MKYSFSNSEKINYFLNIEEDKDFFENNIGPAHDYFKDYYNDSFDDKSYHNNQILKKCEIPETLILTEKKSTAIATIGNGSSLCFSYENIINKLKELKDPSFNIYITKLDKFKEYPEIKEIKYEMKLAKKERKKYTKKLETNNNDPKKKLGRKNDKDEGERKHNRKSPDNIIKKVKRYLFKYLIDFVNEIISNKNKDIFKSLDYNKNVNKIKKKEDIKLLETTIKDYLYQDISRKYFKTPINHNKKLINLILEDPNQKDNEIINFVFKMKIKDWIELFTLKKNIYNFGDLNIIGYEEEIQSKIPSIRKIFDEIVGNKDDNEILKNYDDDIYFTKFVFYLFNYEDWFRNKSGRNRKK